jgi:thiazolylpeptide-type bacteriocin precursor
MSIDVNDTITDLTTTTDEAFASFDIAELEMLEVSEGMALPEMGASSGWIGTSSSSSSTCSAC